MLCPITRDDVCCYLKIEYNQSFVVVYRIKFHCLNQHWEKGSKYRIKNNDTVYLYINSFDGAINP